MKRVFWLLALVLVLAQPGAAAENQGSVKIDLDTGELPVTNGAVTLYQVAEPAEEGYRVLDYYGGGTVRYQDAVSDNLAMYYSELAGSGRERLLDVDGQAVFTGLEPGLYLIRQTERTDGFYPFRPFLLCIPTKGQWDLKRSPAISPITTGCPRTADSGRLILGLWGMGLSALGLTLCAWPRKRKRQGKEVLD